MPLKTLLLWLFSRSVTYDSLQPHGLQHARLPCPSPSPGACSNSCPLSRWCHPTISSSVIPFSSRLRSFPASGSFSMNQLFASFSQSIGTSASDSVLSMNIQVWFPLGLTGWDSQESSPAPQCESINSLVFGPILTFIHDHWENHSFDYRPLSAKQCFWLLIHCPGLDWMSKDGLSQNAIKIQTAKMGYQLGVGQGWRYFLMQDWTPKSMAKLK